MEIQAFKNALSTIRKERGLTRKKRLRTQSKEDKSKNKTTLAESITSAQNLETPENLKTKGEKTANKYLGGNNPTIDELLNPSEKPK